MEICDKCGRPTASQIVREHVAIGVTGCVTSAVGLCIMAVMIFGPWDSADDAIIYPLIEVAVMYAALLIGPALCIFGFSLAWWHKRQGNGVKGNT